MKKALSVIISGLVAILLASSVVVGLSAAGSNHVLNPSLESGTANSADNWRGNTWGNIVANFSITDDAADGDRAARVEVTSGTTGDAKWYFNNVYVDPNTTCSFSDSYKANVATDVTIEYTHNDNSVSYSWLGTPAASAGSYAGFSKTFTTPADVSSMTVFHNIGQTGWLQTDKFNLNCESAAPSPVPTPDPTPSGGNLFLNPSLESGSSTAASNWKKNSWGNVVANLSIVSDAADGDRAARVEMTSGTQGDAKWHPDNVNVSPGTACNFSDNYKSNVGTDVTIEYTSTNGSLSYVWLGSAAASSSYKSFSKSFTTPADAKSMTVFHTIGKAGWLQTDNFNLNCGNSTPAPTPSPSESFNRPLLSIEFDDGWKNAYQSGFPEVERFGYRATQYVITETPGWSGYMTVNEMKNLKSRGHDIGSHTISHPDLATLSNIEVDRQLRESKAFLDSNLSQNTRLFVTPYCSSNAYVKSAAQQYYSMLRNCQPAPNTKQNFDAYNIRSYIVLRSTTNAEIRQWINEAKAQKAWIVLVYHEIKSNPDNDWAITRSKLRSQLQIVKDSNITVMKTGDALNEVQSQL